MESIKKFGLHVLNNAYIYLLGMATLYLFFYGVYFLNSTIYKALCEYDKLWSYLSHVSILFFTTGIFTVSLKYFQFLKIFQDEFNKAIGSSQFDLKLKKQLQQVTFSRKFLIEQSNLSAIWEKVTLCKYQREFPDIYPKVKKKIKNTYFEKGSISYYYKNMQLNYEIRLEDNKYLVVHEHASYTIVRPTIDKFTWDFGHTIYEDKVDEKVGIEIEGKIINLGKNIISDDIQVLNIEGHVIHKVEMELEGHLEYHIERHNKSTVNIDIDREHSFSSDRIIDDLTVNIALDKDLDVIFAPVNKQKFFKNGAFPEAKHSYINRDIFLPGEKFKLFFLRKN